MRCTPRKMIFAITRLADRVGTFGTVIISEQGLYDPNLVLAMA